MSKVSGPLMSMDASGKLADAIVFSKWKGRNYVRQLVIPYNPQSASQQETRAALGSAGRMNSYVGEASDAQTALESAAPSDQSGVGYYAQQQTSRFEQSDTDYNDVGNATEKGYFDTAAASLGLTDITIPGSTPLEVPAGLILWNAYQTMFFIDDTLAPTEADGATEANITTFTDSLTV